MVDMDDRPLISMTPVWTFYGKLITDMREPELRQAFASLATEYDKLEKAFQALAEEHDLAKRNAKIACEGVNFKDRA